MDKIASASEWCVAQGTLRLDRYSAPDPDVMWLPVPFATPAHLWPLPILIIEVSDKTYRKDSGVKLRKYAYAGIQDYWITNINADRVEVHREPHNPTGKLADCRYAWTKHFHRGEAIAPLARPNVSLSVDDLLP
jgi:Uma2 family endonuclease